jgi:hypothetical protein
MYTLTLAGGGYNKLEFDFKGEDAIEQMTAFIEIVEAHTDDPELEIVVKKGEA